jgi:hypothetical protein
VMAALRDVMALTRCARAVENICGVGSVEQANSEAESPSIE